MYLDTWITSTFTSTVFNNLTSFLVYQLTKTFKNLTLTSDYLPFIPTLRCNISLLLQFEDDRLQQNRKSGSTCVCC